MGSLYKQLTNTWFNQGGKKSSSSLGKTSSLSTAHIAQNIDTTNCRKEQENWQLLENNVINLFFICIAKLKLILFFMNYGNCIVFLPIRICVNEIILTLYKKSTTIYTKNVYNVAHQMNLDNNLMLKINPLQTCWSESYNILLNNEL